MEKKNNNNKKSLQYKDGFESKLWIQTAPIFRNFLKHDLNFAMSRCHSNILKQRGQFVIARALLITCPLKAFPMKTPKKLPQTRTAFPCQQNFSLLHKGIAV